MRAAVITRQGDPVAPNVRVVDDHPDPRPGHGDLLLRVEAAALNHLDIWVGRGVPGLSLAYPRITGSDGCGRVEAVGDDVDPSWIGRRVIINAALPSWPRLHPDGPPRLPELHLIGEHEPGCMAERIAVPAACAVAIPDQADPAEAAAFGLTHLTAWSMMVTKARLAPGQTVLITGIGGGVALAALAIARHLGCRTIVTSRHPSKLERATALGADVAIHDGGDDWSRSVRAATGGRGADLCVDSIGGAVHTSCMKSLAAGGAFVTCGCTTGPAATMNLAAIFWLQLRVLGSTMGDMDEFRQVVALFASGALRPVLDSVHDSADAASAYARLESGEQFGKVVVRWSR